MSLKFRSNFYTGETIGPGFTVDRIDPDDLSPSEFFNNYISKRRPLIFTRPFSQWKNHNWSNSSLLSRAGDAQVQVECRNKENLFGTSKARQKMTLHEFIKSLESTDKEEGKFYLTTQNEDEKTQNLIYNSIFDTIPHFLLLMLDSFTLSPALLGNLVLRQVNLWFGKSKAGSSSGLHHDYHDNLYLLLRGRKRFTLFSPNEAPNLYLNGELRLIFQNGLISYLGAPICRSDGVTELEVAEYYYNLQKKSFEKLVLSKNVDDVFLEDEEIRLQHSKKWLLTVKENEDDLEDGLEMLDDFDCYEDEDESSNLNSDENEGENDDCRSISSTSCTKKEPNHFSKIPPHLLHSDPSEIPKEFKLLKNASSSIIEIKSGEMLYLPASWFHEVTSFDEDTGTSETGHLAFNYWLYPPTSNSYDKPYIDNLLHEQWELFMHKLHSIIPTSTTNDKKRPAPSSPLPVKKFLDCQ